MKSEYSSGFGYWHFGFCLLITHFLNNSLYINLWIKAYSVMWFGHSIPPPPWPYFSLNTFWFVDYFIIIIITQHYWHLLGTMSWAHAEMTITLAWSRFMLSCSLSSIITLNGISKSKTLLILSNCMFAVHFSFAYL